MAGPHSDTPGILIAATAACRTWGASTSCSSSAQVASSSLRFTPIRKAERAGAVEGRRAQSMVHAVKFKLTFGTTVIEPWHVDIYSVGVAA